MNRLAVTADDFGLSEPVNAAVEEAHRRGILSAASLMVGAPAAADAVKRARALPNLRVGLHVVLVNDDPMLPSGQIPALVDSSGRLRNDLVGYSLRSVVSPAVRRQIGAEVTAQFEAYRATGLPLDHVNAHRHFHLNPVVAAAIVDIGRRYGMQALRVPVEPWRTVAEIDPQTSRLAARVVGPWAACLRGQIRRTGLITADAVFGLAWSGAMTKARVAALLGRLPPGFVEIYLHPATTDAFAGSTPGYRYADEFAALCDPDCVAAVRRSGYVVGGYADAGE
ncbi:MAG TPA: hopanoid biosynthesis-associated protein HpnK [Xanthobacteraceae bacterium]